MKSQSCVLRKDKMQYSMMSKEETQNLIVSTKSDDMPKQTKSRLVMKVTVPLTIATK
jgi:hypothetical protein